MRSDFAGTTAAHYAAYRRDVPDAVLAEVVERLGLTKDDTVLDLGCGTGQFAVPMAGLTGLVVALDPEADMLIQLRSRLRDEEVTNVLPVLAAAADVHSMADRFRQRFSAITVANALHWMDAEQVYTMSRQVLQPGGGLVVISQGPPMWLSEQPWAQSLRTYLEGWLGTTLDATCGTDLATAHERRQALLQAGFVSVDVIQHAYANTIDVPYVIGHLYSTMSEALVPPARRGEFEVGLHSALGPDVAAGSLSERIEAIALIATTPAG